MASTKSGKIWGNTELIESNESLEFHRIEYMADAMCSEHFHKTKWNGFFVESGVMEIRVWRTDSFDDLFDTTILEAGDYFKVKPGIWHQFIGVESGVAFELYWADKFDTDDIVRRTAGKKIEK
tara:strand:- start:1099 stop:1467 length:369 start_codon:yes stop_codon:yes gene_type:complete